MGRANLAFVNLMSEVFEVTKLLFDVMLNIVR